VVALGIVLDGREQVDHQQVDALHDQVRRLLDEAAQLTRARLVPRRGDLDHGDNLTVSMPHRDPIGLPHRDPILGMPNQPGARRDSGHGQSGRRPVRFSTARRLAQGQDVRIGPRIDGSGKAKESAGSRMSFRVLQSLMTQL
jgi:hypothetical protein